MQPSPIMVPVMIPPAQGVMIIHQMGHYSIISADSPDNTLAVLEGALAEIKMQAQEPASAPIALTVVPKSDEDSAPETEPAPMQSTPAPFTVEAAHDDSTHN